MLVQMFAFKLEVSTLANEAYRRVVNTTAQQQLVLMSLAKNQEIGNEKHEKTTQFIRVEKGSIIVVNNQGLATEKRWILGDGDSITIAPTTMHNVIALSDTKLYTIYSPPEHPDGLVQLNK